MPTLKHLICLLLFSFSCKGQNTNHRLIGLSSEIDSLMNAYKAVGLSIAIVENGQVIYTKGFGYRNLKKKLPVTPNTQFQIGSITKQFTASLIGIYQEQGKLSVYDKPSKHIRNLKFYNDEMDKIVTIEDLLAHRSGIGTVDGAHVFFPTDNIDLHIDRLQYLKLNSKFRERFDYSNMGYAILGRISEKITTKTWSENLRKEIFNPLQMNQTNTSLKELTSNSDFSYGYSIKGEKPIKVLYEDQHESVASGAMNSSANDMAKWAIMLLNMGTYKNKQIIPKNYLESSFSQHQIISPSFKFDETNNVVFDNYGYGWFTHIFKGIYRVNHGGSVSGFSSKIDLFPNKKLGIIVLTNQDVSNLSQSISEIITNRMLKLEKKHWRDFKIRNRKVSDFGNTINSINKDKKPSLPLIDFCGEYINKGYGKIIITLENNYLNITFPAFKMALEHHQNNTFYTVNLTELHQNVPSFYYNFHLNDDKNISTLAVGFQSESVDFTKIK